MYDNLAVNFAQNASWNDALATRDTPTSQLLLHEDFAHESAIADAIDVNMCVSLALLHCPFHKDDTPKVFYKVIQNGGVQQQSWLAADDKDFDPCFFRMCSLATTKIMQYCGGELPYSEGELAQMEEAFDETKEEWLDEVFGVESKMDSSEWMKMIVKKENNWIFDSEALRKKILDKATLPFRY